VSLARPARSDDLLHIGRNAVWLTIGQGSFGLLSFAAAAFLARVLAPTAFGIWQSAAAIGALLAVVSISGLATYGTWAVARHPERTRSFVSAILRLRAVTTAVVVLGFAAVLVGIQAETGVRVIFFAAGVGYCLRAFWPDWVYQGMRRGGRLAIATLTHPLLWLLLLAGFVRGPADLILVPTTYITVAVAAGVVLWRDLWKLVDTSDHWPESLWGVYRSALPLALASIAVQLLVSLDYIVLTAMTAAADIAHYASAARLALFVQGIGVAVHAAALPTITKALREGSARRLLGQLQTILIAVTVPTAVGLSYAAGLVVGLVFGDEYGRSVDVLRVLAWQIPVDAVGTLYANLLIAAGRHRTYALIFGIGTCAKLFMLLILVPMFGIVGAAMASVAAIGFIVSAALVLSRSEVQLDVGVIAATLLGGGVIVAFLEGVRMGQASFGVAFALIVCGVMFLVLRRTQRSRDFNPTP
jgi:O-antigen/teichoic acid export membrane protein